MMMRSMMRACVFDFFKGKEELVGMDDELPIVIYIIFKADVPNIYSELSYVEDFVKFDVSVENE